MKRPVTICFTVFSILSAPARDGRGTTILYDVTAPPFFTRPGTGVYESEHLNCEAHSPGRSIGFYITRRFRDVALLPCASLNDLSNKLSEKP